MIKLPKALDHAPFPHLKWEDYFWVGEVTLPSWAGFQVSSRKPAKGTARLSIMPLNDKSRAAPAAEQDAAFRQLMEHEPAIALAVLDALVQYCPGEA